MLKKIDYKISIIIGTRAELIKTFPVMRELQERGVPYYFIHTGQHSLGDLCNLFKVKRPDIVLTEEPKKSSKFNTKQIKAMIWNMSLILRIRSQLKKLKGLRYVLYHGDTMTTATAAIASSRLLNPGKSYKNIHLEAGLRSWNNFEPFPEEISRQIAGRFSDILFAPSEQSRKNVSKYKNKTIYGYGNTIVDSAHIAIDLAERRKIKRLSKEPYCLITVHRHENLKDKERMEKIVDILLSIPIRSYFAIHHNTRKKLEDFGLLDRFERSKNIKLIEPMDYVSFIYQVKHASLLVCDGGSMQEESLIFGIPCILLRNSTERQEGLETGFQYLSCLDQQKTKAKIKEYVSPKFHIGKYKNPYGNKGLSKKIVDVLL